MAADQQLYDIQGRPIKLGSLVAFAGEEAGAGMLRGRVLDTDAAPGWRFCLRVAGSGQPLRPDEVVVLEEPVWPNS